ncbi:unnamed protein product [Echinostoma caproni]|uniref:Coiled-coil domain-containing protein n=1 Tax=Echinostoma caproni TaxID=27848 RepID=A0A183B0T3_9TREM|nr:unnamed protein product [Echinostoma caproni]
MWLNKKEKTKKKSGVDFPFLGNDDEPIKIDEAELENELMDILGEDSRPSNQTNRSGPKARAVRDTPKNLLKGLALDEDTSDAVEFDENDPDLLAELAEFVAEEEEDKCSPARTTEVHQSVAQKRQEPSGVTLSEINERLNAYRTALENLKKHEPPDAGKIRRYGRSIQVLEGYASDLAKGKSVSPDDFPPPPPVSLLVERKKEEPSTGNCSKVDLTPLKNRLQEYKVSICNLIKPLINRFLYH